MHTLEMLPDDVLILVCQYVQLRDILHLRRTAHRLAAFVLSNSTYIASSVARNTFPNARLLLYVPEGGPRDLPWLKSLVPKFLAAVLVDRYRLASPDIFADYWGIPAESEMGNEARARVEYGLRVWKRISDISRDVYRLPNSHIPQRPLKKRIALIIKLRNLSAGHATTDILERRESLVLQRRLAYLNGLDRQHIEDYSLMFALLLGAFKTDHDPTSARFAHHSAIPMYKGPGYFDWGGKGGKRIQDGTSWVNSFLLNKGPMLFWTQWYSRVEEDSVKGFILRAWEERSGQQIKIEINAASGVEAAWRSLSGRNSHIFLDSPEVFREYFVYRLAQLNAGEFSSSKEIMEDLPYWIDFRERKRP